MRKKDLGMISMTYGYIYVASVAMGANHDQRSAGTPRLVVRFKSLTKLFPNEAAKLHAMLKADLKDRYERLKKLNDNDIL